MSRVAKALAYAHGRGVLHRDIKPGNLLIDKQAVVWITDFGLAWATDSQRLTNTGEVVGTLRYIAPERLSGRTDHRSDIYSLGITLYELATLHPAYLGKNCREMLLDILSGTMIDPENIDPHIPKDLVAIILKAAAYQLESRYPMLCCWQPICNLFSIVREPANKVDIHADCQLVATFMLRSRQEITYPFGLPFCSLAASLLNYRTKAMRIRRSLPGNKIAKPTDQVISCRLLS